MSKKTPRDEKTKSGPIVAVDIDGIVKPSVALAGSRR